MFVYDRARVEYTLLILGWDKWVEKNRWKTHRQKIQGNAIDEPLQEYSSRVPPLNLAPPSC